MNPDVVLVADPADLGQGHMVAAVNLEGTSAAKDFSSLPLDRALQDQPANRVLVHFPNPNLPSLSRR
jgi:hypothetical protein